MLLPRRSAPGLNVVAALVALLAAVVLAWVNLAYGAGDGISPAGWAMAWLGRSWWILAVPLATWVIAGVGPAFLFAACFGP